MYFCGMIDVRGKLYEPTGGLRRSPRRIRVFTVEKYTNSYEDSVTEYVRSLPGILALSAPSRRPNALRLSRMCGVGWGWSWSPCMFVSRPFQHRWASANRLELPQNGDSAAHVLHAWLARLLNARLCLLLG